MESKAKKYWELRMEFQVKNISVDSKWVRLEDAQQEIQKLEFLHKQNYEDSLKLQETVMKLQGCLEEARQLAKEFDCIPLRHSDEIIEWHIRLKKLLGVLEAKKEATP